LVLKEQQINHTFVVFGSARLKSPSEALIEYEKVKSLFELGKATIQQVNIKKSMLENSKYYEEARMFGEMVAEFSDFLICTGGGPGCMAAACKGAFEKGAKTIGMNIVLPFEQTPNPFITPELSFNFHYFSVRKMHLLARAKGLVVFPGGFGTLDELFEAITLVQTRKMKSIPIILVGVSFWNSLLNFDHLVNSGFISPEDVHVFSIVETAVEAWERILHFYETK
jgi:uncharacterized protein (TIGR00730 family)